MTRPASEHADELEPDVTDPTDADDRRGRARGETRKQLLDGVVGGDSRVGVRRDLGRIDALRQPDQRPLVDEHVLGEAPVSRQPRELVALAVDVEPASAGHADAAAVRGMDEHGVADRRRRHVVADRMHPAGVLVAEDDRQRQAGGLHEPVLGMKVGRADPGPADLDDDAPRAGRLGLGPLHELERAVVLAEERRSHAATSACAAFSPR